MIYPVNISISGLDYVDGPSDEDEDDWSLPQNNRYCGFRHNFLESSGNSITQEVC